MDPSAYLSYINTLFNSVSDLLQNNTPLQAQPFGKYKQKKPRYSNAVLVWIICKGGLGKDTLEEIEKQDRQGSASRQSNKPGGEYITDDSQINSGNTSSQANTQHGAH